MRAYKCTNIFLKLDIEMHVRTYIYAFHYYYIYNAHMHTNKCIKLVDYNLLHLLHIIMYAYSYMRLHNMYAYVRTCTCAYFLNQAHAGRRPARAWFLEITFIPPKYVCVCVCVHPRGHK